MTTDLTTALTELAQAPAPPSSIDASRARAVGRQRLRRRKTAAMAGIITVALAAALTPAALPGRDANPTDGSPAIDRSRSPLVAKARFGWLPQYIKGVGYQEGYHGTYTVATGDRSEQFAPRILLSVYPPGTTPPLDKFPIGDPLFRVPAPAVNGRTAYWATADAADPLNGGSIYLRWQATRDQWAEIHAYYLPDTTQQEDVHRAAAGASIGDRAVPLPLYITGLPTGLRLIDMNVYRPSVMPRGLPWDVEMIYEPNDSRGPAVTISVSPTPSAVTGLGPCTTANGLDLCIDASFGVPPALDAIGGVAGLRSRITLLGPDEHNWTTDVIR